MAIVYYTSVVVDGVQTRVYEEPKYVGRVLRVYTEERRVMSDIYAPVTFARVVNDDGSVSDVHVNTCFELETRWGYAEVDFDQDSALGSIWRAHSDRLAAEYEAQELMRKLEEEAKRAKKELNKPVMGKEMRVVKGRKVPVGTTGVVAWISAKTGGVLLKNKNEWQNKNAQGVWVQPEYLEVV